MQSRITLSNFFDGLEKKRFVLETRTEGLTALFMRFLFYWTQTSEMLCRLAA